MAKPKFSEDQIVPASVASRTLGTIRKRAKVAPQFISDNNKIDTVILDYVQYEKLIMKLDRLEDEQMYEEAARRIKDSDSGNTKPISLKETMSAKEYEDFERSDPDEISDEELFEN
ncbi:MAG: hypothetical protein ACE3JK_16595 [Sporolactobacillus sp.]